jgi:hypothetical protein
VRGGSGEGPVWAQRRPLHPAAARSSALLSACVAPFSSGDTPLQYYNMALTLATANECADAGELPLSAAPIPCCNSPLALRTRQSSSLTMMT